MPTALTNGSIIQVTWWQTYQGQELLNVQNYRFAQGTPITDYRSELADLLNLINAAGDISALQVLCCSTGWNQDFVTAQPIYPFRLALVNSNVNAPGVKAGTQAPANVAADITKQSDVAARYGIGTWHQGGLVASDVAGGMVSGGLETLLGNLADKIIEVKTTASGGVYTPVLWGAANPLRVTEITDYELQTQSRVMRRRTVGVGV